MSKQSKLDKSKSSITKNTKEVSSKSSVNQVKKPVSTVKSSVKGSSSANLGIGDINFTDLFSTGKDIVKTVVDVVENPLQGVLEIPKVALKTFDSVNKVADALNTGGNNSKVNALKDSIVKDVAKSVPVITTTNIPTAFSSQVDVPDVTRSSSIDPEDGIEIVHIKGMAYIVGLVGNGALNQIFSIQVIPSDGVSTGSRVAVIAKSFQKWRFRRGKLIYINKQGNNDVNTVGNVLLSYIRGVENNATPNINELYDRGLGVKVGAANQQVILDVPSTGKTWYQTLNSTARDKAWYSDVIIEGYTFDCTNGINVGDVSFEFEIEFKFPMEFDGFGKSLGMPDMMGAMVYILRNAYMQVKVNIPYKAYVKFFLIILEKLINFDDSVQLSEDALDSTFSNCLKSRDSLFLDLVNSKVVGNFKSPKGKLIKDILHHDLNTKKSDLNWLSKIELPIYKSSDDVNDLLFSKFNKEKITRVFGNLGQQYVYFRRHYLDNFASILSLVDNSFILRTNRICYDLLKVHYDYLVFLEDPSEFYKSWEKDIIDDSEFLQ